MDVEKLLEKYFKGPALEMVMIHGRVVAALAGEIASGLSLPEKERQFIFEAAMLHDIGVCRVKAADINLFGEHPYLMHGIIGRQILEQEGLFRHALACERHIGIGLSVQDIVGQNLPLPQRDMQPVSEAERIICFADLFFSKKPGSLEKRKRPERVRDKLAAFGEDKLEIFDSWMSRYGEIII